MASDEVSQPLPTVVENATVGDASSVRNGVGQEQAEVNGRRKLNYLFHKQRFLTTNP